MEDGAISERAQVSAGLPSRKSKNLISDVLPQPVSPQTTSACEELTAASTAAREAAAGSRARAARIEAWSEDASRAAAVDESRSLSRC